MISALLNPAQIISVDTKGKHFKPGKEMRDICVLQDHSVIIEDTLIKDIIPNSSLKPGRFDSILEVKNKVILPGLIDCHTHTAFAGSRADEFKQRLQGLSYEEISKSGGGINKTVSAVRNLSSEELLKIIKPRVDNFISQGVTTLEIKSGYGLDFKNEIKLLKVINHLNDIYPIDIVPTFLGAHTFPLNYKENRKGYLDVLINEMLPFVAQNRLSKFCDGFCEATAFLPEEIDLIFSEAERLGLKTKLHTNQFNSIGGISTALKHKCISVEHLEVISDSEIEMISKAGMAAVLLPGVSFFLDYQFAPARKLIDNNVTVALSTDYNPGSSNIASLSLIMSLAAIKMKMTVEEIISAVTINPAKALDINSSAGSIEIGKKADFAVLSTNDYSEIVYNIGTNLNSMTIKNGNVIYKSTAF
ncbi:MAG TPA: imidazolonepropionase [Ignavibacteriaceae bacterium]|nr:imidazolonepropionase [Ignavibacteriaceae bacterium]